MTARKVKLSVTLSEDLVATIDRQAQDTTTARSAIMERWLRQAARRVAERELEQATMAYYEAFTQAEREEEEALSRSLSSAARRLTIDDGGRRRPAPKRAAR